MRARVILVLMLLVSILVSGCEPAETPPPAPEYIEIGASVPLTGKYGSLGGQVLPGYQYAVDDINAAGGVYVAEYDANIPLRLTYYDDESDPTRAVSRLETLYSEENMVAFLGTAGSDMHAAATAVAERYGVPYLGVAFALWQIHQQGYSYLFSPFPKSPDMATGVFDALNELLPEDERPTNVAIFQETTDWGIELGALWQEEATEHGYEVVYYEEYAPGSEDFSSMILGARDAGAETVLALPNPPNGIALIRQMSELGWAPAFTFFIRAPDGATWGETLGTVGDYVALSPGWHHGEDFPGVDELNAAYEAEFGRSADVLTGPAYACVQILADAIERAGTLDRDAIRDAIADTDMTTVVGPVTFNEDGTGNVLTPLIQWQNGAQELVWPLEHATADFAFPAPPFEDR